MKGVVSFKSDLKERIKNKKFKKDFDEEEIYANIALQIAKERENMGITQTDLAGLLNTSQQAISRLEDSSYHGYSLNTLVRLASVFDRKLKIKFV